MVKPKVKTKEHIVIEAVMAEVTQCRAEIAQLKKTFEKLLHQGDRSIQGFCARRGFSLAHFYNLQAKKRGPKVTEAGGRKQVTEEHEREWDAQLPLADTTTNDSKVPAEAIADV